MGINQITEYKNYKIKSMGKAKVGHAHWRAVQPTERRRRRAPLPASCLLRLNRVALLCLSQISPHASEGSRPSTLQFAFSQ